MKILTALFVLLAVSASAQINTGIGWDTTTPPDGVIDVRLLPLGVTSDGTVTFSVSGKIVTLSASASGGVTVDTSNTGYTAVAMSPAYFRNGEHVDLYIDDGWLKISASANADSILGKAIDSTGGYGEGYSLSWDTANSRWQVEPVTAGDAHFIGGYTISSLTGIQDWDILRFNDADSTWVLDQIPGLTAAGTIDSVGVDTGGVAGIDFYVNPIYLLEGDNISLHRLGTDTIEIDGSLGLLDTLATRDTIYYRSTVTGDTLWKVRNNNATAQTIISTDSRQTYGFRFNGVNVLDMLTGGASVLSAEIGDIDAGTGRSYLGFYLDTLFIGTYGLSGNEQVWRFIGSSMYGPPADNLSIFESSINGAVEWNGNRFDNDELDTTAAMAGLLYKYCTDVADSALVTLAHSRLLIGDSLDEYPLTTAMTAADNVVLTKMRDSVNLGSRSTDFQQIYADSGRFDTLAVTTILAGTGAAAGMLGLSTSNGTYTTYLMQPANTFNDTILLPSDQGASGEVWTHGTGNTTSWAAVPSAWAWADSAGEAPFWVDSATFASEIDTTAAAFQAYVGDHGAGGFWDTLTNLDTTFWDGESGVTGLVLSIADNTTHVDVNGDTDTLRIGGSAARVYNGPVGKAYADSIQIGNFIEGSNGKYLTVAEIDSIADALGRFSATGGSGSADTLTVVNTAGTDSLDNIAGRVVLKPGTGAAIALSNDTATISVVPDTALIKTIVADSLDEYSTTSGMITILADSLDEYALTTAVTTLIADSLDEYVDTVMLNDSCQDAEADAKLAIRDTVKVIPISRTIGLMDPKNFATDTVPLIHFDSTAYAGAVTLQRLEFSSPVAVTDTILFWEWADAPGTGSESPVDTLILSAATSVISIEFNDASFARGSWLVATRAKSGNTILMENVTVTFIGGN